MSSRYAARRRAATAPKHRTVDCVRIVHTIRSVVNKVRRADQPAVKADPHRIMHAGTLPAARSAASPTAGQRSTRAPWRACVPIPPICPADLLTCLRYKTLAERKAGRTTNASERRFREVRRRTRPMGTFQDKTSMERILFAVVTHQHRTQRLAASFAL